VTAVAPVVELRTAEFPAVPEVPPGKVRLRDVMASEWTKLRSLRSTSYCLLLMVAVTIGLGMLFTAIPAARWPHVDPQFRLTFDPTRQSLSGLLFGQLMLGVLGVLAVSSEYGTGTIRATLTAVPRRPLVLVAKVVVFGLLALAVSEALMFVTFFIGQAILSGEAPHATLSQPGVLRAIVGGGIYLTLLGLLAMGFATIHRQTAGAISAFVGVLLILPLVLQFFPASVNNAIGRYVPANIGATVTSTRGTGSFVGHHAFNPWVGLLVLAGYAAVALLIGGWRMVRRDA
jgi:ABC-type transport system involved in multi-copper enzyme maturation permease subunit